MDIRISFDNGDRYFGGIVFQCLSSAEIDDVFRDMHAMVKSDDAHHAAVVDVMKTGPYLVLFWTNSVDTAHVDAYKASLASSTGSPLPDDDFTLMLVWGAIETKMRIMDHLRRKNASNN